MTTSTAAQNATYSTRSRSLIASHSQGSFRLDERACIGERSSSNYTATADPKIERVLYRLGAVRLGDDSFREKRKTPSVVGAGGHLTPCRVTKPADCNPPAWCIEGRRVDGARLKSWAGPGLGRRRGKERGTSDAPTSAATGPFRCGLGSVLTQLWLGMAR